jgi:hypothetical protein
LIAAFYGSIVEIESDPPVLRKTQRLVSKDHMTDKIGDGRMSSHNRFSLDVIEPSGED